MSLPIPPNSDPPDKEQKLVLSFGKWKAAAADEKSVEALERLAKLYRPVIIVGLLATPCVVWGIATLVKAFLPVIHH